MTHILNLAFVILCVSVGMIWTAAPVISVNASNVANAQFEADAQQALQEAYVLFPKNQQQRIETFASLFNTQHPIAPGWNVAEGCAVFYRSLKTYSYVALNVDEGNNKTTVIKIYN